MREIFVQVNDMKCSGCEGTIRKRLLKLDGIYDARANFKTGKLVLNIVPEFQLSKGFSAMTELGYTLEIGAEEHT